MDLIRGLLLVAIEATKSEPSGLRHWLNENVGVIAAAGVVARPRSLALSSSSSRW